MKRYVLLFFCCTSTLTAAPRLNTLILGDPSESLREITGTNCQKMAGMCKGVANLLNIRSFQLVMEGASNAPQAIDQWLGTIQKDDIALFYYSGFAARAPKAQSPWPVLVPGKDSETRRAFVYGKQIQAAIKKIAPRFALILFDSSNKFVIPKSACEASESHPSTLPGLATLFLHNKGVVTASATAPEEVATVIMGGETPGGIFTTLFWDSLEVASERSDVTWECVLQQTGQRVAEYTSGQQNPVYKVDVE